MSARAIGRVFTVTFWDVHWRRCVCPIVSHRLIASASLESAGAWRLWCRNLCWGGEHFLRARRHPFLDLVFAQTAFEASAKHHRTCALEAFKKALRGWVARRLQAFWQRILFAIRSSNVLVHQATSVWQPHPHTPGYVCRLCFLCRFLHLHQSQSPYWGNHNKKIAAYKT